MEVQKSDQQENIKSVSDYYINRRSINTDEINQFIVYGISITEDDELAIQTKIGGEDIVITISDNIKESSQFFNKIINYNNSDLSCLNGKEFQGWVSPDLKRFGFTEDEIDYRIYLKEDIELKPVSMSERNEINAIWSYFNYSDNDNPGWQKSIKKVNSEKETLSITVELIDDFEITWDLSLEFQSDISEHPVAKFIEEEGSGDPKYLEDMGEVFIVHKDELEEEKEEINIETLGLDRTGKWELLTKKQHEEWLNYDPIESLSAVEIGSHVLVLCTLTYLLIYHSIHTVIHHPDSFLLLFISMMFIFSTIQASLTGIRMFIEKVTNKNYI